MSRLVTVVIVICLVLLTPFTALAQMPSQTFPETGYSVADTMQSRFLTEFRRFGGVDALGYPISEPFVMEGFNYQAFQRGVLQWRPEAGQAYLANVMDWLSDKGKDPYLSTLGIPAPLPDAGGTWQQVVSERESWLTDGPIAQAYRAGGGYNRFGLPASRPERAGPFVVQRFQRYSFQHWVVNVAGMPPAGSVVGVLAGDLLKQAGVIPGYGESPAPHDQVPGITFSGRGATVTPQFTVESGIVVFDVRHTGAGGFAVKVFKANGEEVRDEVVDDRGQYEGRVAWAVHDDAWLSHELKPGPYTIGIEADGNWSVRVIQPTYSSGMAVPATFSGSGTRLTEPFVLSQAPHTFTVHASTAGSSTWFVVRLIKADGSRVEILPYGSVSSSRPLTESEVVGVGPGEAGVYILSVEGDCDWSISVE